MEPGATPASTGPVTASRLRYLHGYPAELVAQVAPLLDSGALGRRLLDRYPARHAVRTDRALYDYVLELKTAAMRSAEPLSKVGFDSRLQVVQHALGTHTTVSRVQGSKLRSKREIRIASLFKDTPAAFLRMIVVHELAHLKERAHGKAFYQLCVHMEPEYHQIEFDLRLYLCHVDLHGPLAP